jgi:hypothetical protein
MLLLKFVVVACSLCFVKGWQRWQQQRHTRLRAQVTMHVKHVTTRRRFFQDIGVTSATIATVLPPPAPAADKEVVLEAVIPELKLVSGLATAARRNIIITGANSGASQFKVKTD